MNYIGAKYDMLPDDLLLRHKGEKTAAYWSGDIIESHVIKGIMFAKDEDKAANIEKLLNEVLPEAFLKLEKLLGDTKYICGDKLTLYDF